MRALLLQFFQEFFAPPVDLPLIFIDGLELGLEVGDIDTQRFEFGGGAGPGVHLFQGLSAFFFQTRVSTRHGFRQCGVFSGLRVDGGRTFGELALGLFTFCPRQLDVRRNGLRALCKFAAFRLRTPFLFFGKGDGLAGEGDLALDLLHFGVDLMHALTARKQYAVMFELRQAQFLEARIQLRDAGRCGLVFIPGLSKALLELGNFTRQRRVLQPGGADFHVAELFRQFPVTNGRIDLAFQGAHVALYFGDDVAEPQQVIFGGFELAQRRPLTVLVFDDPRRLLKQKAPVVGFGTQDEVHFPLADHRVRARPDAGIHEQLLDIL